VIDHAVVPAVTTNVEEVEIGVVLAGEAIGLLTGVTASAHVRSGRLVPLLTQHVTTHSSLFVYYGSRSAPARARAFIDLAVRRLADSPEYVLGAKELATAEAKGRKAHRVRAPRA
jgi:DNA-binding transcriptional LysR family regulator